MITLISRILVLSVVMLLAPGMVWADSEILIIRHGEKPELGLGQLNCKGFNRSLALPEVLIGRFGKPDTLVAPNPGVQKADKGVPFAYIRPLATLEPLAITLEKPVEADLAFNDVAGLERRFDQAFTVGKNEKILVAWEHKVAEQVVRNFLQHHDISVKVPHWDDDDFDSIFILSQKGNEPIRFHIEQQGLNKVSEHCAKL